MVLTRAQRLALKRVFDRGPIYVGGISAQLLIVNRGWRYDADLCMWVHPDRKALYKEAADIVADFNLAKPINYCAFRKLVQYGSDCIMVPWQGMWLGIEPDGYTHS